MVDIRALTEDQWRPAIDLFLGTLHRKPVDDAGAAAFTAGVEPGRLLGAFDGGELIGTANSMRSALRVPGGGELPMSAVTDVGVRADRTRRGVLTALMRHQLATCGTPAATLRASETGIYRRFGYGIATRVVELTVDTARAGLVNPRTVRMLNRDERLAVLPGLHRKVAPPRVGAIARPDGWWRGIEVYAAPDAVHSAVLHEAGDGYAWYSVDGNRTLVVHDVWAASPASYAELWAFLLSVDLVRTVIGRPRPLDEPVDLLLADPRAARVTGSEDETWLRLVDVPAALAARGYGAETVLLGVTDPLFPANSGGYRIGADGAHRVDAEPELHCDVATLATLYLGDRRPSELAFAGLLTGAPDAVRRADTVFGRPEIPWCGTYF